VLVSGRSVSDVEDLALLDHLQLVQHRPAQTIVGGRAQQNGLELNVILAQEHTLLQALYRVSLSS
jgi:hypothetical protein